MSLVETQCKSEKSHNVTIWAHETLTKNYLQLSFSTEMS